VERNSRPAAFGGPAFEPRPGALSDELGGLWAACGQADEVSPLQAVLLHRPGPEIQAADPDRALQLATVDWHRARVQHDALAEAFRARGVAVYLVAPPAAPPPNQVFAADLLWMTPEGAVLARPAARVRAGEERWVARRLAELGIPIRLSVGGRGRFEGADAAWLDPGNVLLARGLRTDAHGADQVAGLLTGMGVRVHRVELPEGCMHLMGQLRFLDRRRAAAWLGRLPDSAQAALGACGYEIVWMPDEAELSGGSALNFVTLAPGEILMPAGNPRSVAFFEGLSVTCHQVQVDELAKAAGGIGCMTGVIQRSSGWVAG